MPSRRVQAWMRRREALVRQRAEQAALDGEAAAVLRSG